MKQVKFQALEKIKSCTEAVVAEIIAGLEDALDTPKSSVEQAKHISTCIAELKSSAGVMQLLNFKEATLLFNEIILLLSKVGKLVDDERQELLQLVYSTVIDAPALLDKKFAGEESHAHDYLLLINRLRKIRGASLVFSIEPLEANPQINFRRLLKKQPENFMKLFVRQKSLYGEAVTKLNEGLELEDSLAGLTKIFTNLEMLCRDYRLGTLWSLSLALLESVDKKTIIAGNSAIRLLCSYQGLLDKVVQDARTLEQIIPEQELERIFDELSKTKVQSKRLRAVKYWYNLDISLSGELRQTYNRLQANYARQEAGNKGAGLLLEQVRQLSESINQAIKDENCNEAKFREVIAGLESLAYSSVALSLRPVKDIIDATIIACIKQLGDLESQSSKKSKADTQDFLAIQELCVQFLYKSELWLQAYINGNIAAETASKALAPFDMYSDARQKLVQELSKDIELLFLELNDYVDSGCSPKDLAQPISKLKNIGNVLQLLQFNKAAVLAQDIEGYFTLVAQSSALPDPAMGKEFFVLAEVLVVLSDYLQQVNKGNFDELMLDKEVRRLNTLNNYFDSTFSEALGNQDDVTIHTSFAEDASNTKQAFSDEGVDQEIRETFIEESAEIIDELKTSYQVIRTEPAQQKALEDLRRGFHTLKGSGRMVGADVLVEVAAGFEEALNLVISTGESLNQRLLNGIEECIEKLPLLMDAFKQKQASSVDIETLLSACRIESSTDKADTDDEPEDKSSEVSQPPLYAGFTAEAQKQLNNISTLLEQTTTSLPGEEEQNCSNFIISLHTLVGSSKMAGLEAYANLLRPLEKILETYPAQELNADLVEVFRALLVDGEAFIELLNQSTTQLPQALPENSTQFQEALVALNMELSSVRLAEQKQIAEESEAALLLAGFLQEARQSNAKVESLFKKLVAAESIEADKLSAMLDNLANLEGAAKVIEQKEFSAVSHALISCYQVLEEKQAVLTDTNAAALSKGHAWLKNALEQLDMSGHIENPQALIEALEKLEFTKVAEPEEPHAEEPDFEEEQQEVVDEALLLTFLEEAEELLQELESNISQWQMSSDKDAHVDEILRILHTLKGSSALVGEIEMSEQAHSFESLIVGAIKLGQPLDRHFFTELNTRLNVLQLLFSLYHRNEDGELTRDAINEEDVSAIIFKTEEPESRQQPELIQEEVEEETRSEIKVKVSAPDLPSNTMPKEPMLKEEKATGPAYRAKQPQDENVRVSSNLLKSLLNDAYEINVSHNRMESSISELVTQLNDIEATMSRLESYKKTIEAAAKTGALSEQEAQGKQNSSSEFDALEMESYSELHQVALSLREDYEDLHEIKSNLISKIKDVDIILSEQQSSANNLQQGLISSQMIPFASIFPRLRRLTHQLGQTLGKDVAIHFSNTEDRLDRTVTQVLIGPLEHMLRNAIDHGIESAEVRKQNGKTAQANIQIKLYRQAGNIVLDVIDDGAGINVDKVREKAIERGLLTEGAGASEKELLQFLLDAGFSTSDALSNISGRGVGLDVVAREVSQIGGELEILSQQGQGTTFRIHLPMTSTLHRSLQFTLEGQQFVVLLNSIDAIMQEPVASLKQRYQGSKSRTISYADKQYELQYMGTLLDESSEPSFEPSQQSAPLLLVAGEEKNIALQIDSIIKSKDLIVKSLGTQFSAIPGLGGGVILGDGQVVLVLDPVSIVNAFSQAGKSLFDDFFQNEKQNLKEKQYKTVLVVDDSLTVRKVTSMILKRHGMHVLLAKNGLEAVEILKSTRPDVVLLDIEMPKMDGFEVASFIRSHEGNLKDLPIIMITSRVGEKHRNRAAEIGVNEYMCKPFQEKNLLEAIDVYH